MATLRCSPLSHSPFARPIAPPLPQPMDLYSIISCILNYNYCIHNAIEIRDMTKSHTGQWSVEFGFLHFQPTLHVHSRYTAVQAGSLQRQVGSLQHQVAFFKTLT